MQKKTTSDYVIATGNQYTVKQFVDLTLNQLGIKYYWKGSGIKKKCFDIKGKCIVECDKEYFRPLEVDTLLGDASKAKNTLGWSPDITWKSLAELMVESDLRL